MPEDFGVTLEGVDEFLAKLEATPAMMEKANRKAMEKVTLRGEAVAKERVPRRTGQLFGSITGVVEGGGPEMLGRIGPHTDYAKFVEFGTGMFDELGSPHRIDPGHVMAWKGAGGMVFARSTQGMRAQHYMRPASEAVRTEGPLFFQAEAVAIRDFLAGGVNPL